MAFKPNEELSPTNRATADLAFRRKPNGAPWTASRSAKARFEEHMTWRQERSAAKFKDRFAKWAEASKEAIQSITNRMATVGIHSARDQSGQPDPKRRLQLRSPHFRYTQTRVCPLQLHRRQATTFWLDCVRMTSVVVP